MNISGKHDDGVGFNSTFLRRGDILRPLPLDELSLSRRGSKRRPFLEIVLLIEAVSWSCLIRQNAAACHITQCDARSSLCGSQIKSTSGGDVAIDRNAYFKHAWIVNAAPRLKS